MPKQTAISKVNEQYLKDRENGYTREYSNTENTARQMLEEYEREQEEQRRKAAEEQYQQQYSQFQGAQNAELADWIRGMSPTAMADAAQQQRLDAAKGIYTSDTGEKKTGSGRSLYQPLEIPAAPDRRSTRDKKQAANEYADPNRLRLSIDPPSARGEGFSHASGSLLADDVDDASRDLDRANGKAVGALLWSKFSDDLAGGLIGESIDAFQRNRDKAKERYQQAAAAQTEAQNRYNSLSSEYQKNREWQLYGSLWQNPDFEEKSYGNEDTARRGANSPTKELGEYYQVYHRKDVSLDPNAPEGEQALYADTPLRYMTEDEAANYFYLWNTKDKGNGPRAAHAYLEQISSRLNERRTKSRDEYLTSYAKENPISASLASVPLNLGSAAGLIDLTVQNLQKSLGSRKPIDYNTDWQDFGKDAAKIRDTVAKELEARYPNANVLGVANMASFVYMTGMSIADSIPQTLLAMFGAPVAVTNTLLGLQGASAALQSVYDAKARGVTDDQALLYGYATGIAEAAFEKISLDFFVDKFVKNTGQTIGQKLFSKAINGDDLFSRMVRGALSAVADMGVQGGVEASEESFTSLANTISDLVINRDKSELVQSIQTKINDALSMNPGANRETVEKAALKRGLLEWFSGLALDALGGAISGGLMGGAGYAFHGVRTGGAMVAGAAADTVRQNRQEANPLGNAMASLLTGRGVTAAQAANIQNNPEAMQTLRSAGMLQNIESGAETLQDIRQAVMGYTAQQTQNNQQASETTSQLPVQNQQETAQERTTPPLPRQMALEQQERATAPPLPQNAQNAAQRTTDDTLRIRAQEETKAPPLPPLTVGSRNDIVNENRQEGNNGRQAQTPTDSFIERARSAGTEARQNAVGYQRTSSVGRFLENLRNRADLYSQGREAVSIRNQAKARNWEQVSAKEIGMAKGTDAKTVRVAPDSALNRQQREAKQLYADMGVNLHFVQGQFETEDIYAKGAHAGEHVTARAWISADKKDIWVQMDHPTLTWNQLLDHEETHRRIQEEPGYKETIMEALLADKEIVPFLSQIIDSYSEAYATVGMQDSEDVIEEMLADYRAGFNMLDPEGKNARTYSVAKSARQDILQAEEQQRLGLGGTRQNGTGGRAAASTEIGYQEGEQYGFGSEEGRTVREEPQVSGGLEESTGAVREASFGGAGTLTQTSGGVHKGSNSQWQDRLRTAAITPKQGSLEQAFTERASAQYGIKTNTLPANAYNAEFRRANPDIKDEEIPCMFCVGGEIYLREGITKEEAAVGIPHESNHAMWELGYEPYSAILKEAPDYLNLDYTDTLTVLDALLEHVNRQFKDLDKDETINKLFDEALSVVYGKAVTGILEGSGKLPNVDYGKLFNNFDELFQRLDEAHKGFETWNKNRQNETENAEAKVGVALDSKTESANPGNFSIETWNASDYVQNRDAAAEDLAEQLGVSNRQAKKYINDINSIAKIIANDRVRLDYTPSPNRSSFIGNTEYGGSIDFSTICKKRRLYTGTIEAIQKALPNTAITADELLDIRAMMKERGYEVSCGLCYVEGSRVKIGEYTQQFLNELKGTGMYVPTMAEMNTSDGQETIRAEHSEVYEQYVKFMNKLAQRKPKLFQMATEYQGEILKKFKNDGTVDQKNRNGGLRLQSFSDFEIIHLIDTMQVIMDMSRVGLAGQAYTKVPDFAWALGDTGLKINLSLIAKGVDENGHIILDEVEGMKRADAEALRNAYSKNVGTILVTFNDEQLKAAMADPFIDFIIPFHRSQWSKAQYDAIGLPKGTKDYTDQQNESYTEKVYNANGKPQRPANYMPNNYWDFNKSGKENAEAYLRMCAENNRTPKFYKLLVDNGDGSFSLQKDGSTDGYWKLLSDFKMYDNAGKGSPQLPVKPKFNMEQAERMLNEYTGGHQRFPVAQDVVDDFLKGKQEGKASIEIDPEVAAQFSPEAIARRQSNRTKGVKGERKVSRVRSNTYEYSGLYNEVEAQMDEADEENYTYNPVSEKKSMNEALGRLKADFDGEVSRLSEADRQWGGSDLDTAMGILHRYRTEGRATGDYSRFWDWSKTIQEKGTKGGQFIQAFAKYTRTGTGAAMKGAKDIHDRFKLNPAQQKQVDAAKKKLMDGIDGDMSGAAQDAMKQAKGQKDGTPGRVVDNSEELKAARRRVEHLESRVRKLKDELAKLKGENRRLGKANDRLAAKEAELKKAEGDLEKARRRIDQLSKKNAKETQRRKDAERLVREISKLFEKQQDHGEPVENWLNLTGEELARKIAGRFSEPKQRAKTTMQTVLSDLVGFAEEHALPDRKKAEGTKRTAIDTITDYLNNRDAYGTAWAAAQSYLRAAYTDDQEKLDALNSFLTATIAYNAEGTDRTMLDAILQSADVLGISEKRILELTSAGATASTIDRIGDELVNQVKERMGADYDESFTQQLKDAVRRHITGIALQESAEEQRLRLGGMTTDAARQLELNLQKLLTQSRGDKNRAAQSVADYLIRELGIPSSDAAIAAERITGAFMDELANRADRKLQQMFAEKKPKTQEQRDRLLDLIRLGGLTNSNVEDAVVDALGIGGMSRERQRELVGVMAQFGETLDAMEADDLDGLKDLIRAQAAVRNTPLSRQAEKTLAGETDAEYLREFALAQLDAIAGDFAEMSSGAKISTFQTISHLLNMRTALRNLTSNQVFDLVDSAANNLATIPDMVIGAFTGKRTVGVNKSWLSEMKRAGAKQGAARNALEVRLDVSPDDRQKSKYGTAGRRTNSMAASNAFGRILSHLEEVMGYELNTTDELHKGSVRGETLESLARFVERGDITQEQANAWAEEEALYRSFQDDTLVGNIMGELKTLLNVIGFGDSGKTNSRGRTIHDFGLGDLVVKYTQVPGALIHRGIEYSPLGYAKMLYDLAIAKDSLVRTQKRGEDVTNAQRKLALDIGRATTGSGLITLFAVLAKAGLLRRDDDDKDKNAKAMHAAQGLSGTQLNLTALKRWIEGGDLSLTDGDVLADIGFLEPLDSLMTIATLMANDDDLKLTDIGVKSLDGVWKAISNTSAMQTISNIISTVQYHDEENDLPLYFQIPIEIASDSVSGFIPSPVRQLAQATDTTYRDQYRSKALNDQIRAKVMNSIPGVRQMLAPKITPLGEDKKYQKPLLNYLNSTLNPGNISVYQASGVVDELNRVYAETEDEKIWPERNAPYSFKAKTKPMNDPNAKYEDGAFTLTPDERTQYQRTRGQQTSAIMEDVIGTDWYKAMDPTAQADVLNWIGNFSNYIAKKEMLANRELDYGSDTYDKYYASLMEGTSPADVVAAAKKTVAEPAEELAAAEVVIAEAKIPEASKEEAETMSADAKRFYAGFLKGGVSDETARKLATELDGSEATGHEQWRIIYDNAGKEGEKAVTSVMTDDMKRNWEIAKTFNVSMDDYIGVREGFIELNGKKSQTQAEWNATLDNYKFSDNEAEDKRIKGAMWQIVTGSESTKNNPYDKEAGQAVLDAKAKGGGKGTGSNAPARIPTLRIPAAPTVAKPTSGLRIRGTQATTAPRSGLRIRAK